MNQPGSKYRVIPIQSANVTAFARAKDAFVRLERAGWRRQVKVSEPRLSNIVEIYNNKGYEVYVEYEGDEAAVDDLRVGTIYTRKSAPAGA